MYRTKLSKINKRGSPRCDMSISVRYPLEVKLQDGSAIRTDKDTWMDRHLVVETDRSEEDVRNVLSKEGFGETRMEYPKSSRLGHGMIKEFEDWQVHVRLFRHGKNIQIDGEVEVSKKYCEHLTHGWLPAFDLCIDLIEKHFGEFWVYHKECNQYVQRLLDDRVLNLDDPESKTDAAILAVGAGLAIGAGVALALLKK